MLYKICREIRSLQISFSHCFIYLRGWMSYCVCDFTDSLENSAFTDVYCKPGVKLSVDLSHCNEDLVYLWFLWDSHNGIVHQAVKDSNPNYSHVNVILSLWISASHFLSAHLNMREPSRQILCVIKILYICIAKSSYRRETLNILFRVYLN